jgi:uncharacterized protein (TIGR02996 family)
MAKTQDDIWTTAHVKSLAPDEASIPAAQKVLKKGGFGTVEPTSDGRGWWVVCRGLTDTYQVTVRGFRTGEQLDCACNCLSYKYPCKHVLALLLYLVEHPELRAEVEAPKAAASDFEGLLRAVFADPEDDTARLVFADFLEENNEPDRAALIRYQVEQARLKPNSKRHKELKALLNPLLKRLKDQIGPLPVGLGYQFRRGFVRLEGYSTEFSDLGALPVRIANLFRDGWVETLATVVSYEFPPDLLALIAQVGELDMSRYEITDDALVGVVAATAAVRASGRLRRVTVHSRNRAAFARLLKAESGEETDPSADLGSTRRYHNLTPERFQLLLRFGRLSGAHDLFIQGDLGTEEARALVTADLRGLRHLRLNGWTLAREALQALVTAPALQKLATVSLTTCRLQPATMRALVASPLFQTLKTLDLSWNTFGKATVAVLADAPAPASLKQLLFHGTILPQDERKRLKSKYRARMSGG